MKMQSTSTQSHMLIFLALMFLASMDVVCLSDSSTATSSSWAKLQISPDTFSSMKHGSFRVNIYEHADNKKNTTLQSLKKYYYAPIALLNHKSAVSFFNNVTKQKEMSFSIEMWNDDVESKVVKYLSEIIGQTIKPHQVQVMPLEKVVLASTKPSKFYSLSNEWLPYSAHKSLGFTLSCFQKKDCDQLAANMRSSPKQFESFKLLFSLDSQTSQTRETIIRIDNVVNGDMVSKMLQRYRNAKEAFLTADDEKRMLSETSTNVLIETFDDSEVVSSVSEKQIYNQLKDLLISSRRTIKAASDKMWDSVFWNDDNYRPDKSSRTMNEVYKRQDKETQKKMSEAMQKANREAHRRETSNSNSAESSNHEASSSQSASSSAKSGSAGGGGWGFSFNAAGSSEQSKSASGSKEKTSSGKRGSSSSSSSSGERDVSGSSSMTQEGMDKLFDESKDHVQWDGEKFVPKPMSLSRVNLAQLRDKQALKDKKVSVRYSTAVLSTPINFVQNSDLVLTDDWTNMKNELDQLRASVTDTKNKLEARTRPVVDIGKIPSSCSDLQQLGHTSSGFYSIQGAKQIETVYCNFQKLSHQQGFQTWIGYNDVKSTPTYFYVQKNRHFSDNTTPILFDIERLNTGGAMNLKTGIFTAPVQGKYFFFFSAIAFFGAPAANPSSFNKVQVSLKLNGATVGKGEAKSSDKVEYDSETISLQSALDLKKGEKVWLELESVVNGQLWNDPNYTEKRYTHFTGWLLQEDISLS